MQDPALAQYFRRFPPASFWLTSDSFLPAFQGYYVILAADRAVGLCNLANVDAHARKAEFGLMIAPQPEPRGATAVAALKLLFDYAFSHAGLNKLYCLVQEGRGEIEKLATRWGLRHEGTLRDNIFYDGRFHDEKVFSLLAAEYFRLENR